jgi:Sap, sulfolipid-1-addressing protein
VGDLLLQMLLYGLAAFAAAPIAIVVSALILGKSRRPQASAWTFTAGAAFLDVVLIVVVLAVLAATGAVDDGGDASAYLDVGLGALFLAMGLLALFSKDSPEKDAARKARAEKIASARLPALFAAGILVQLINIDAMAVFGVGLKEVPAADVSTAEAAVAVAFGLAVMLLGYYGPALLAALSPERGGAFLVRMAAWIMANSKVLEVVVGIAFGVAFLAKGLQVLV